jgi:TLC domain
LSFSRLAAGATSGQHHIVAIAYLSAPVAFPEFRWFMGACLSVEINTWFLILRRVIYKRRHPQIFQDAVAVSFYISWVVIRCYIYPAILFVFLRLAAERVADTQRLWHWPMVFIPVHFFLCVLNLKWSYDLFEPLVRKWISNDSEGTVIASGL